ncbi:MAG: hypothetical protein LBM66_00500, partial [Bifidobacteriaceae bacterium]|nr:hypothetical protein [Bifidobacteriaceae bacterium]
MELIDNVNRLLGDDLKAELKPGSHLRVAAATFSIYAFEALRDALDQVGSLDFLFTARSFQPDPPSASGPPRQRRQFFIPHARDLSETALANSPFELRLRNRLTQRAVAR